MPCRQTTDDSQSSDTTRRDNKRDNAEKNQPKKREPNDDLIRCAREFRREKRTNKKLVKTEFIRSYAESHELSAHSLLRASNDNPELFDATRTRQKNSKGK
jgi:hypothetical protein